MPILLKGIKWWYGGGHDGDGYGDVGNSHLPRSCNKFIATKKLNE